MVCDATSASCVAGKAPARMVRHASRALTAVVHRCANTVGNRTHAATVAARASVTTGSKRNPVGFAAVAHCCVNTTTGAPFAPLAATSRFCADTAKCDADAPSAVARTFAHMAHVTFSVPCVDCHRDRASTDVERRHANSAPVQFDCAFTAADVMIAAFAVFRGNTATRYQTKRLCFFVLTGVNEGTVRSAPPLIQQPGRSATHHLRLRRNGARAFARKRFFRLYLC